MRAKRKPYAAHCERNLHATEEFLSALPRSVEGEGLSILGREDEGILITDGARTALYVPCKDKPLSGKLRIAHGNTESGWFGEAAIVFVGNGRTVILYEPLRIVDGGNRQLHPAKGKTSHP